MKEQYQRLLPILRATARAHGYALGLHGSGERDLDLIAVPWVDVVSTAETLVEALRAAIDGYVASGRPGRDPTIKPHGRRAWSIHLHAIDGRLYIDLSVYGPPR